jgi:hypothetical protein
MSWRSAFRADHAAKDRTRLTTMPSRVLLTAEVMTLAATSDWPAWHFLAPLKERSINV